MRQATAVRLLVGRRPSTNARCRSSAQSLADIHGLVYRSGVEGGLPRRDLAVAHDPDLNAKSLHALTRAGVFPLSLPNIRHDVVHQGAKLLVEPISPLLGASRFEKFAKRLAPPEFRDHPEPDHAVLREAGD